MLNGGGAEQRKELTFTGQTRRQPVLEPLIVGGHPRDDSEAGAERLVQEAVEVQTGGEDHKVPQAAEHVVEHKEAVDDGEGFLEPVPDKNQRPGANLQDHGRLARDLVPVLVDLHLGGDEQDAVREQEAVARYVEGVPRALDGFARRLVGYLKIGHVVGADAHSREVLDGGKGRFRPEIPNTSGAGEPHERPEYALAPELAAVHERREDHVGTGDEEGPHPAELDETLVEDVALRREVGLGHVDERGEGGEHEDAHPQHDDVELRLEVAAAHEALGDVLDHGQQLFSLPRPAGAKAN